MQERGLILMLTVTDVSLSFTGQALFKDINLKFVPGNCYGIIGANGAGKSTFLKILAGTLEPTKGSVSLEKNCRMSVLEQDHYKYDEFDAVTTVIMGNRPLYDIMIEKDAIYAKPDFSEEDGVRAGELEARFAELDGWEAESDAAALLNGLGVSSDKHYTLMSGLDGRDKVKVLLAQALFRKPDVVLLDEPTNDLDIECIEWLEEFLMDFPGAVIVVSHDRHFLNAVCTHIVDIDYNRIQMYTGNYDFWYESSRLMQQLIKNQNKKREEKIRELQSFIQRFSANKSKSKQATARRRLLDNITVEEMPASSRRYPFVGFEQEREAGKDILSVNDLCCEKNGQTLFRNVTFTLGGGDKVAVIGENDLAKTELFKILAGEAEPTRGAVKWGVTITRSYFPSDNTGYFEGNDMNLVDWLRQYSKDQTETYIRGFLGRMLFSGDEVYKPVKVLSGGEKVRCMLSRMMMFSANMLLLDQPTNHLDLESITAVNEGLCAFKGNVIFTCHDLQFVETVANRIIEIREDGCTDFKGTFEEYMDWKARNRPAEQL